MSIPSSGQDPYGSNDSNAFLTPGGAGGPSELDEVQEDSVDENDPFDPASPAYDPKLFEQKRVQSDTSGTKEVSNDVDSVQPFQPPDDFYKK